MQTFRSRDMYDGFRERSDLRWVAEVFRFLAKRQKLHHHHSAFFCVSLFSPARLGCEEKLGKVQR